MRVEQNNNEFTLILEPCDKNIDVINSVTRLRTALCQIPRLQALAVTYQSREELVNSLANLELQRYITELRSLTFPINLPKTDYVSVTFDIQGGSVNTSLPLAVTLPIPSSSITAKFSLVLGKLPYVANVDDAYVEKFLNLTDLNVIYFKPSSSVLNAYTSEISSQLSFNDGKFHSTDDLRNVLSDLRALLNKDIDIILNSL